MEYIADTYLSSFRPDINFTAKDFTYVKVKDNIGVSVCNAAKNEKLLQDVPHEINGDFALTYHVKVKLEDQGEGVIQIHNSHLDLWGIDENTLREVAWQNMEHRFPTPPRRILSGHRSRRNKWHQSGNLGKSELVHRFD